MRNDGGPAFPFLPTQDRHGDTKGMSLRDWMAGQALSSLLSDSKTLIAVKELADEQSTTESDVTAAWAYELADAMLKARGK